MRLILNNHYHLIFTAFLSLCMMLCCSASAQSSEPLIVAYRFDSEPIQYTNEAGKADGMLIDIWRLWSEKSGRPVRFVAGNNEKTQEIVKQGQADVIAGLFLNERREGFLDFTESILASPYYVFYNRKVNNLKSVSDLTKFRVAVTRGSYHEDYIKAHFPDVQLVLFNGYGELFTAADKDEIDVFITQPLFMYHHVVSSASQKRYKSLPLPIYTRSYSAAVTKGRSELLDFIQHYMAEITAEEKAAISTKWVGVKWTGQQSSPKLSLTAEEQAWIKAHRTIRLGVDPAWPPFEYFDGNGEYAGLGADFIALFNQKLNIDMQPVKNLSWNQVLSNAQQGTIDVLPVVSVTPEREQYLNYTKPYLVYPYVIFVHDDARFVTSIDDLYGKTVAVEKSYVTESLLRSKHPDINIKTYETTEQVLLALSQGSVDAYFGNLSAGMWMLNKLGLTNIKVAAPTPYKIEHAIGVRKDWPELVTILNKAIDDVSTEQRQEIKNHWFAVGFDHQVNTRDLWRVALIIAAVAFVIFLLMLYWNRKLQAEIIRRRQLEEKLARAKNAVIQAGREQFDNLTEGSIQGIWIHVDWKPLFSNQALASMLGYHSAEEILALSSIERCIAPHERGRLRAYRKARKAGKQAPEHYEFDAVCKDGKVITLDNIIRRVKWQGQHAYQSTMVDITARKKAERQLMEEKVLAESIIDSLPGSFFMLDNESNLLHWNHNLEVIHGLDARQLNKMKGYELIHPHHRKLAEQSLYKVMSEGAATIELDVRIASGEAVPFLVSAVRTQIGSHTRIIGVAFDVSQQQKVELELRQSEMELAEAQRIAHMGNWAWNQETKGVFWADEVFRIFGYIPGVFEPDADLFSRHVHPDDCAMVLQAAKDTLSGGTVKTLDFRIFREDKVERTVRVDARMDFVKNGMAKRMIGIIQDITDRKQTEYALADRERQFRDLIEGSIQGIVILRDNKALFANKAMANILGLDSAEALVAMNDVMSLVAPYHRDRVFKYTQAWFDRDSSLPNTYEFDALRADGSTVILENIGRRVNWQGKTALQCTYLDITDRKLAERARELEFTNAKLQELDELKSLFIASMSHELRTPLNSIIGFTGVLLQGLAGPLSDEQADQLQRVYNSGKHLLALITDVIDISKIEAGRLDVFSEKVDVCGVVNEAIDVVKPDADKTSLKINFLHEEPCIVDTDKKRCYQCILNLVSNAVKYSEHGQVDISINDSEKTLFIIIKDSGIGISNNDLKNLFMPFERMESHLKIVRGGTGLGLYLTKKMAIELLGGNVAVESVQGEGSVFTLSIAKVIDVSGYTEKNNEPEVNVEPHSEQIQRSNMEALCYEKLAFIASMSHELRTPLNSIIGFSGILNKGMVGDLNEQQSDQMYRIQNSAYQLLQQISSVVDLAKIGIDDLSSVDSTFNLKEVVSAAVSMVDAAAQDKKLPIAVNVPESINLCMDKNRLKQCVFHLIDNAVRYTERGQIELNAKVDGELLQLDIIDTAKSESDNWMQNTQLLNKSLVLRNNGQSGPGLSLYLVRHMVTRILKGELQFHKHEKGGTRARLVLPIRTLDE